MKETNETKYLRQGLTLALEMMTDYELEEWKEAMEKFESESKTEEE